MCGVIGYLSFSKKVDVKTFYDCHLKIKHRGPDDEGFVIIDNNQYISLKGNDTSNRLNHLDHILDKKETSFIFGQRRLSIIDLSYHGHQPVIFENFSMVYNGEIYNYIELRGELEKFGYTFFSESDTEVVLKSYHKWGMDAFNKFNGMWSIAIFDKSNQTLILSRDRFGKKPMFYCYDDKAKTLFFASEMKAIMPYVKTTKNEAAIKRYLRYGENQNNDETFYNEIHILKSANYLIFDKRSVKIYQYWDIERDNVDYSIEEFEGLLESSIDIRLRSDVPIGAALSGGFDSSTIVSFLSQSIEKNKLDKELHTFTAYFPGIEEGELAIAKDVLEKVKASPHFIKPKVDDIIKEFGEMMYHQEQPVMGVAVFVHWLIMKEVSKHKIPVFYSGHGGDELFGGYYSHYINYILNDIVELKLSGSFYKAKKFLAIRPGMRTFFLSIIKSFLVKKLKLVIIRKMKNDQYLKFNVDASLYNSDFDNDFLKSEMYSQIKSYPLNEWLQYEDRNAMAFGIESRVPFLDYRLVEYAFNVSNEIKFSDGDYKYILREVGKKRLPTSLLHRKDKYGFTSNDFFSNKDFAEFYRGYVLNDDIKNCDLFNYKKLESAFSGNALGKHDSTLWRIFGYSVWNEIYVAY